MDVHRTRRSVLATIATGVVAGCSRQGGSGSETSRGDRSPTEFGSSQSARTTDERSTVDAETGTLTEGPDATTDGSTTTASESRSPLTFQYADDPGVPAETQSLDVYPAREPDGGRPVVVYVHGGGWVRGDRSAVAAKPRWVRDRHDGVFVSVGYRLSSLSDDEVVHPAHVRDLARGVAWVLDNVRAHGGDPNRTYLMGHSAGAHLVALAATAQEYARSAGWDPADLAGVFPIDAALYDLQWAHDHDRVRRRLIDAAFGPSAAARESGSPQLRVDDADGDLPGFTFAYTNAVRKTATERFADVLSGVGVETTAVDRTALPGNGLEAHLAVNRRIGTEDDPLTTVLGRKITD
jgi:acetyl esterase/lipase